MTPSATYTPHYTSSNPFCIDKFLREAPHLRDAAYFLKYFNPFLNKHVRGYPTKTGSTNWVTYNSRLSHHQLQKALTQTGHTFGWFTTINTNVIGIDIDDHGLRGGWFPTGGSPQLTPSRHLFTIHKAVINRFGFEPSLTVRSPRGLHLYYLLEDKLHHKSLHELTRNLLDPIELEIKPTPSTALRIPTKINIVDPFDITAQLYPSPSDQIDWESIKIYPIEHLFGSDYRSTLTPFTTSRQESSSTKTINTRPLREAEAAHMPFTNGNTNDQLLHIVPACRSAGMELLSTISLISSWLNKSPSYTGDLQDDPDTLTDRITTIFQHKDSRRISIHSAHSSSPSASRKARVKKLAKSPNIKRIASQYPHPKQAQNGLATFLANIINWKIYHDEILTNQHLLHQLNDKYPFYIHNRRQGFYPLPHSLLTTWNSRHSRQLKWLISIGILTPAPFKQLPHLNICKYFKINWPFTIIPS